MIYLRRAVVTLAFVALSAVTTFGQGGQSPPTGYSLSVGGEVTHPLKLTAADLAKLPRRTVRATDHDRKEATFEGVELGEVLRLAGVEFGERLRGKSLALFLVAEAADEYRAVFALPELDRAFTNRVVLLADRRDGKPLAATRGAAAHRRAGREAAGAVGATSWLTDDPACPIGTTPRTEVTVMKEFDDRVAVVTGANRGIGLEVARQLTLRGFTTVLGARNMQKGEEAARSLQQGGLNVIPVRLDVTDQQSIDAAKRLVEEQFGKLDVLINNAAILYDEWQRAENANLDTVREAFETNTLGPWRMCQAFIPLLRKSKHARIVNVSSESGSLAVMGGGTPAYSVSKVALNALTRMLADELRSAHVLVNSVCPGWVATEMGGPDAPRTVEEGAASVIWAATLSDDGPTGGFFRDGAPLAW